MDLIVSLTTNAGFVANSDMEHIYVEGEMKITVVDIITAVLVEPLILTKIKREDDRQSSKPESRCMVKNCIEIIIQMDDIDRMTNNFYDL